NGLNYYLVPNTEPHDRAELALVIEAGSVLEDDDQLGLAHFLEHMLFNGTKNFPNQELINFLETVGMEYGPDVNAYTSFDETVYTLTIPLDDPETTQKALQVLVDWAAFASLDPTEIDKERGVIVEEWRTRLENVNGRLNEKIIPALYGKSRYSERLPIGDMDIVRNAPYEALQRFYDKWYRPDLMAVVAVGDFDVSAMEEQIRSVFSTLSNPAETAQKEEYSIAYDAEPEYLVITDPELSVSVAQVVYKRPAKEFSTVQDFADDLARGLFSRMLNIRLDDLTRADPAPFLQASYGISSLAAGVEALNFGVFSQEGEIRSALSAMLAELERVQAYGFNDAELARAKAAFLANFEQNYNQRADIDSASISSGLVSTHLDGSVYTSMATDLELAQQLLDIIDLKTVNSYSDEFANSAGRLVLVAGPEKEDLVLPNEAELAKVFDDIENIQVAEYQQKDIAESLMTDIPSPRASLSREHIDSLDVEHVVLANGINLYIKKTDFVADQVLLSGVSYGGSSVYEDSDFQEANMISGIVQESGVANFDLSELEKILAAKNLSVGVSIGNLSEGISGSSSKGDI
ncbi:MAG TPA: insulinase family protein, partial [Trueperaceae bacterium]|nr:insulinase family protein [Trueperaceae bacterium]